MPETSEKQLSAEQSRLVAAIIREQLARRRMSRQHLADQAKISISTLEKALSGRRPFTLATTVRLEEALGVSLRKGERRRARRGARQPGAGPSRLLFAPGGQLDRGLLCDAAAFLQRSAGDLRLPDRNLLGRRRVEPHLPGIRPGRCRILPAGPGVGAPSIGTHLSGDQPARDNTGWSSSPAPPSTARCSGS